MLNNELCKLIQGIEDVKNNEKDEVQKLALEALEHKSKTILKHWNEVYTLICGSADIQMVRDAWKKIDKR